MPLDPYSPCPAGTGKKLKFCCQDLIGDLDKIERMIQGDQRLAALEHIEKLEATKPDRACLLASKIEVLGDLKRFEEMRQVVDRFVELHPENPVALAEWAIVQASEESASAGIRTMQQALHRCRESMPQQVYEGLGTLVRLLMSTGQPLAAKAHLALMLTIAPEDKYAASMLMQLNSADVLPLPLRDSPNLLPCPAGVAWNKQFDEAARLTRLAQWPEAEAAWSKLADGDGASAPAVWHNLALVRTWLADSSGAVDALRRFVALDVPLDDAVDAETLAELLDADGAEPLVETVELTYSIEDIERLVVALSADRRAVSIPIERDPTESEPPPRASFLLLDRPRLDSGAGVKLAEVPRAGGHLAIYGKQTDRPARAELQARRGVELDTARQLVAEVAADAVGAPGDEQVIDGEPLVSVLLSTNLYLPPDTPPLEQQALAHEDARQAILERWANHPLRLLDGKSPRAAAAEGEKYRVRLLAAVALLEMLGPQYARAFDFDELRRELKLPIAAAIDPWSVDLETVPLARLPRLDLLKLSDDDLLRVYVRAASTRHRAAISKLAAEVLSRPSLDGRVDKAEAAGMLADSASSVDDALKYYERAVEESNRSKRSPAQWYLAQLPLRLVRNEPAEFERLIRVLTTKHAQEPGVREALMRIMYSLGMIGPDGAPVQPRGEAAPAAAPAATEGGIWTPGGETAQQGGKSGLWLPGMQ